MDESDGGTEMVATEFRKWLSQRNVGIVIALYTAIYALVGVVLAFAYGGLSNAGIFGDMFGSFNAFVSGLAMLGVIGAILLQMDQNWMQAQELGLQRQELQLTRDELKGQKEALEEQNAQARRTSEAAIMSQLMVEYDNMRKSVRTLQAFYRQHANVDQALDSFRNARTAPDQNNDIVKFVDPARFRVSRFFVRMRKLSTGDYVSRRLIWRALGREAIQDVFLDMVDPLDQVVNQIAGKPRSLADHNFYWELLDERRALDQ